MHPFPTRYYDILRHAADGKLVGVIPGLATAGYTDEENALRKAKHQEANESKMRIALGNLADARVLYAPGDLGTRIHQARPTFVTGQMIRMPIANLFIEMGAAITFDEIKDTEKRYGLHLMESTMPFWHSIEAMKSGRAGEPTRTLTMVWYYRTLPDNGKWHMLLDSMAVEGPSFKLASLTEDAVLSEQGPINRGGRSAGLRWRLEALSFLMFLNSSNVSYERRPAPRMERPKDRYWWRPEYGREFEALVIKDVSKRIALALRRNESGVQRQNPYFVRGHFKILSYCTICGVRRGIRRFLQRETCRCGTVLEPDTALTKVFWWEGHWAGPDVVDRVLVEREA